MEKLDLHRTKHSEVERKVIRFIENNLGSGEEVEIVTGNSDRMRGLVINILNEYGLNYQIGRVFDLNNKGYIVTWME
ncbi:MAG: hypothetical protein GQ469_07975 [Methanosarcinales archaeon]|nr:hypothetical protein [Methanosarcinales archaeon]